MALFVVEISDMREHRNGYNGTGHYVHTVNRATKMSIFGMRYVPIRNYEIKTYVMSLTSLIYVDAINVQVEHNLRIPIVRIYT